MALEDPPIPVIEIGQHLFPNYRPQQAAQAAAQETDRREAAQEDASAQEDVPVEEEVAVDVEDRQRTRPAAEEQEDSSHDAFSNKKRKANGAENGKEENDTLIDRTDDCTQQRSKRKNSDSRGAQARMSSQEQQPSKASETRRRRKPSLTSKRPSSRTRVPWEQCYDELKAYQEENGNCLVPSNYAANPQLSRWVSNQRAKGVPSVCEHGKLYYHLLGNDTRARGCARRHWILLEVSSCKGSMGAALPPVEVAIHLLVALKQTDRARRWIMTSFTGTGENFASSMSSSAPS